MKETETSGHRSLLLAGVVAVILAAAGGHLIGSARGRSDSRTKKPSSTFDVATDRSANGAAEFRKSGSPNSQTSLEKIHQRLWKIWSETPNINSDPEASAEIDRIVAGMSSLQIETFLNTLPPGSERGANWQLRQNIVFRWILQDGPAALDYMENNDDVKTSMNQFETTQALRSWTEDQPEAAFAWMSDSSVTPQQKWRAEYLKLEYAITLSETDPDPAFEKLSRMDPDYISKQLGNWSVKHGADEELRKRLLDYAATTGRPEDLAMVRSNILRALVEQDPAAAKEFMDSLNPDDSERRELDLAVTLARARKEPKAAFDDWMENNDTATSIPPAISFGIGAWMWEGNGGAAIQWLDDQPPGEKRDALYGDSIPALAGFGHFDKAAQIAGAIESPDLRASALHALELRWSLVNRDAAEKWKQGLSAEDRMLLGK